MTITNPHARDGSSGKYVGGHWLNKKSPEAALVRCSLGCRSRICIGAIKCWSTKKKNLGNWCHICSGRWLLQPNERVFEQRVYELHTNDIGGPRAAASLVASAQVECDIENPITTIHPPPAAITIAATDGLGGGVSSDPSLCVPSVAGED